MKLFESSHRLAFKRNREINDFCTQERVLQRKFKMRARRMSAPWYMRWFFTQCPQLGASINTHTSYSTRYINTQTPLKRLLVVSVVVVRGGEVARGGCVGVPE